MQHRIKVLELKKAKMERISAEKQSRPAEPTVYQFDAEASAEPEPTTTHTRRDSHFDTIDRINRARILLSIDLYV